MAGAVIPIACHYEMKYSSDSAPIQPTWIPFSATVSAEDNLQFSLTLMTSDWLYERGSGVYFLGDPINIEASVRVAHHSRVFVSSCVATLDPRGYRIKPQATGDHWRSGMKSKKVWNQDVTLGPIMVTTKQRTPLSPMTREGIAIYGFHSPTEDRRPVSPGSRWKKGMDFKRELTPTPEPIGDLGEDKDLYTFGTH
ncbi:uncharacterized protein LOC109908692 [Oncorhynchus kisutch]|uniref:uncharacterized protein LOC109908692 n=1 Tax=Oncorhynchus kisutch TaxID=8019 RepID=UPI0009A00B1E|nr:uncharacterized protein LOC109908692 [Oncorhynchus kisutch]